MIGWILWAWLGTPLCGASALDALRDAGATADAAELDSFGALERHFADALAAASESGGVATARVRLRMGDAARARGLRQLALVQYEQGLDALRDAPGREAWSPPAKSFSRHDALAQDLEWPPARPLEDLATPPSWLEAALLVNIGNLYQQQGQLPQAAEAYRNARALADEDSQSDLQGVVRVNAAWLALRQGDAAAAIRQLEEIDTMGLTRSRAHKVRMRRAWLVRGEALIREQSFTAALRVLKKAHGLYYVAKDRAGEGLVLVETAEALEGLGDLDDALEAYASAAAIAEGDVRWAAPLGLARIHQAQGRPKEAMAAYLAYLGAVEAQSRAFGTDEGRFSIIEGHAGALRDLVTLATEVGDASQVHDLIQRVRQRTLPALLGRSDARALPAGTLPAHRFEQPRRPMRMMEQRAVATELEAGSATGEERSLSSRGIGLPQPEGTVVLAYFLLEDRLVITASPSGGAPAFAVADVSPADLEARIRAFRAGLGIGSDPLLVSRGLEALPSDTPPPGSDPARELYDLLVKPVEGSLASGRLVIVPDGPLWNLPFGLLTRSDTTMLADRAFTLAASESAAAAIEARPRPARDRALIVGNPGQGTVWGCNAEIPFDPLPGADEEARGIHTMPQWEQADLLVGDQADALRLDAWHSDYGVLHLATHGVACPNAPLESFLLLGQVEADAYRPQGSHTVVRPDDPRLPISREPSLSSSGPPTPRPPPDSLTARHVVETWRLNADLVTLSACQSGLGQTSSEGVIGLSRAFLAAGARSLLVSLWNVDDRATKALMIAFYKGYLAHGDKARALRDAIAKVRQTYPSPGQWGAFTIVGAAQ